MARLDVVRVTSLRDPVHGTPFTFSYGAAGTLTGSAAANGNTTALTYDPLGRAITSTVAAAWLAVGVLDLTQNGRLALMPTGIVFLALALKEIVELH